jgi:hypothetical protein
MEPVLIGAGLGAAGSAIQGKNPLQGALMGGATGGVFGGASNLMNTGALLGASPVGAEVARNAMATNIASAAPQAAGNWAMVDGTLTNMDYYKNILGTPVFTGGQGTFANAVDMAGNAIPETLSKNLTPNNLLGVGNLLANFDTRAPMQSSPIAALRQGQAPQQYAFNTGGLIRG